MIMLGISKSIAGERIDMTLLTDDDGNVITDVRCPISKLCGGLCCEMWRDAMPTQRDHRGDSCPHLGARGCRLTRDRMPITCATYLCALALLATGQGQRRPSHREIRRAIRAGRQYDADAYLGISLVITDGGEAAPYLSSHAR